MRFLLFIFLYFAIFHFFLSNFVADCDNLALLTVICYNEYIQFVILVGTNKLRRQHCFKRSGVAFVLLENFPTIYPLSGPHAIVYNKINFYGELL